MQALGGFLVEALSQSGNAADASSLIENRLYWRCDVTLAEDACQVRKGSAPHVLAVLNSFVLALFDFFVVPNAKQQMRYLDAQPLRAVQLLLKSLGEY